MRPLGAIILKWGHTTERYASKIHVKDVSLGQVQALQSDLPSVGSTEDMTIKKDFKLNGAKDSL